MLLNLPLKDHYAAFLFNDGKQNNKKVSKLKILINLVAKQELRLDSPDSESLVYFYYLKKILNLFIWIWNVIVHSVLYNTVFIALT